jgi:hypothetical protein
MIKMKKHSNSKNISNMMNINFKNQFKVSEKNKEFEERIIDWVTFYRRNIHRFIEHYFGLELHMYEKILLFLMNLFPLIVVVACRASAKSYIIAIFACAKAVLYPGSIIVIASSTKKQSSLIVSEKIQKELMPQKVSIAKHLQ